MEKLPSVLETLDDLPLFTATEVSQATGIGRKSIGKRSKKYDLGEEKYLTEGFQRTPRTYFSVGDAVFLLGEIVENWDNRGTGLENTFWFNKSLLRLNYSSA